MNSSVLWLLAIGMAVGMVFYARTGLSCGGLVTPGIVAAALGDCRRIGAAVVMAAAVWAALELLSRAMDLYGRQRIAMAMFLALVLRIILGGFSSPWSLWLGWAVPGLMAADFQRQGFAATLGSALSGALVTAMVLSVIQSFSRISF